jgi:hypothetical protein
MMVFKSHFSLLFVVACVMSSFAFANESNTKADVEHEDPIEKELEGGGSDRRLQAPSWYGPAGKVTVTVYHDQYPKEIAWRLSKGSAEIGRQKTNSVKAPYKTIQKTFPLGAGRYRFRIADSAGDGLCCTHGQGYWTLSDEYGDLMYASTGDFGSSETISFELY